MNRLICLSAMLGWASWASAQAPEAVSEKDFLGEMPMVLSVSRLPQRLDETPGAVTILDRDMIRLSGARDVADLLRLVPGFQTSTSFEKTAPVASYHGGFDGYSNRMQVLVDGRSVYSPYFIGSIGPGLQAVALTDIERIEVLRGSNSAAYGARAMLGVINIVTRDPLDTLGVQAGLSTGENGIEDAQARVGWSSADANYRLSMDRRADAGLSGANGRNQVSRVNLRADVRVNARDELQFRAGSLGVDASKGTVGNESDLARDTSYTSNYLQLDWRRSLSADEDLALIFAHTQETYSDVFPHSLISRKNDIAAANDFGIPQLIEYKRQIAALANSVDISGSGRASNDSLTLQHTFRANPRLRMVWGGEMRQEQVSSKPLYNTDSAFVTDFTRLFGNAEWLPTRDLVFNAGALFEHSSVSGDSFAPRVMLNWHVTQGQTLRAGVSRAFRPPSTFERDSNIRVRVPTITIPGFVISPDTVLIMAGGAVEPESVTSREIGYLASFPTIGLDLDVRLFDETVGGFIRQKNDNKAVPKSYTNTEEIPITGLEYQLKWQPWQGAQLIFNQAYTEIKSYIPGSNTIESASAMAAPKLASSLIFFQKLPGGLDLSLMHQDSGTAATQDGGADSAVAMTRTDLRVGMPLRFGRNRGEVAVVVQNLGMPYADFSPNFQFERRAFVTLRVEN